MDTETPADIRDDAATKVRSFISTVSYLIANPILNVLFGKGCAKCFQSEGGRRLSEADALWLGVLRQMWSATRQVNLERMEPMSWLKVTALMFSHLVFGIAFHWASTKTEPYCVFPAYEMVAHR